MKAAELAATKIVELACPFCSKQVAIIDHPEAGVRAVHAEPACEVFAGLDVGAFMSSVNRLRAIAARREAARS